MGGMEASGAGGNPRQSRTRRRLEELWGLLALPAVLRLLTVRTSAGADWNRSGGGMGRRRHRQPDVSFIFGLNYPKGESARLKVILALVGAIAIITGALITSGILPDWVGNAWHRIVGDGPPNGKSGNKSEATGPEAQAPIGRASRDPVVELVRRGPGRPGAVGRRRGRWPFRGRRMDRDDERQ